MLSVIIPTFNEEKNIVPLLKYLQQQNIEQHIKEIIVCDGGSRDATALLANEAGARVLASPKKGRATQMNYGANCAAQPVLYFLHADTYPPAGFTKDILQAVQKGYGSGCYRLQFDSKHWFLKANCWFTRFNVNAVRFGDQSLFVTKEIFDKAGGFNERLIMLEDQEIMRRLQKLSRFIVLPKAVTTSARKYLQNGIYRTQGIYFAIYFLYRLGYPQQRLLNIYRKLIVQDKL